MESYKINLLLTNLIIIFLLGFILVALYSELFIPWLLSGTFSFHITIVDIPDIIICSLGIVGTSIFFKYKNISDTKYLLAGFFLMIVYMMIIIFANRSLAVVPDRDPSLLFVVGLPIALVSWMLIAFGYFNLLSEGDRKK